MAILVDCFDLMIMSRGVCRPYYFAIILVQPGPICFCLWENFMNILDALHTGMYVCSK